MSWDRSSKLSELINQPLSRLHWVKRRLRFCSDSMALLLISPSLKRGSHRHISSVDHYPRLVSANAGFERSGDMEMARQIAHEMRVDGKHIPPATSPTHGPRLPVLRPPGYGDHSHLVRPLMQSLATH